MHVLLFYSMAATAAFTLLEAGYPHNMLLSCGRVAAAYLQGAWFFVASRALFESE